MNGTKAVAKRRPLVCDETIIVPFFKPTTPQANTPRLFV